MMVRPYLYRDDNQLPSTPSLLLLCSHIYGFVLTSKLHYSIIREDGVFFLTPNLTESGCADYKHRFCKLTS